MLINGIGVVIFIRSLKIIFEKDEFINVIKIVWAGFLCLKRLSVRMTVLKNDRLT